MRTERHRTVVVGLGRLGSALGVQLRRAGWPVQVRTRSPSGRRQATRLGLREADEKALAAAEICLLAVPDSAVAAVARAVAPLLGKSTGLVHCAGALTLEVLAPVAGWWRTSMPRWPPGVRRASPSERRSPRWCP